MGLDMQRVEGHSFLGEVGKGSRVLLWVAHNGVVKGHSGCIVEKGLRRARRRGGRWLGGFRNYAHQFLAILLLLETTCISFCPLWTHFQ